MYTPLHRAYLNPVQTRLIKGMANVDHRQRDRQLVLWPSMIKFQAPEWSKIEIVRTFDRPSLIYLNRPLVMVLEGLGVEYKVFADYQAAAVLEAENARGDFKQAGRLLDPFRKHLMDFAINHVLRELKYRTRIPIPGYTLVGVADIHGWLEPEEVFACIVNQQTKKLEYLE